MRAELERQAEAALEAAGHLARRAQPGQRSRALTLADQRDALYAIECSAVLGLTAPALGVLASAANLVGEGITGRRPGDPRVSMVTDVYNGLRAALSEASSTELFTAARGVLQADVTLCEAAEKGTTLASMAERTPRRNLIKRGAEETGRALFALANGLQSHRTGLVYPIRPRALLADVAVVVGPVMTMLGYLESAIGHEALLIDWVYEEAGMASRAESVSGILVQTGQRLARARRTLEPVSVVVRYISDEDDE